jgi:hypothetical protein
MKGEKIMNKPFETDEIVGKWIEWNNTMAENNVKIVRCYQSIKGASHSGWLCDYVHPEDKLQETFIGYDSSWFVKLDA